MTTAQKHPFYDRVRTDLAAISNRVSDSLMDVFPVVLDIEQSCKDSAKLMMDFVPEVGLKIGVADIAVKHKFNSPPNRVDVLVALSIYFMSLVDDALEEYQIHAVCNAIDKLNGALNLSPETPIKPEVLVMLLNEAGADTNDAMKQGATLQ